MFNSVSQGENPAYLQMNQKGMRMIARPMMQATAMMGRIINIACCAAVVSGISCNSIAKKFIESAPEWDENFAAKVQLKSGIRNEKLRDSTREQDRAETGFYVMSSVS
jgi:hypothetical protein